MKVVVFGTYDVSVHPRGAVLIEGLADHGIEVVELNEPLGLGTADRVAMLQRPGRLPLLVARLAGCWMRLGARSLGTSRPDAVLVPYLGHFDVLLARLRWPRRTIVLDHLVSGEAAARDRGESGGLKLLLLRLLDRAATRAADVVVVDTDESAAGLPDAARRDALVVPVGATADWFDAGTPAADRAAGGPLRVVFFGSFTPLHGTVTVARALQQLPEGALAITLLGTGQDHAVVRRILSGRGDVTWRDWVPTAELPGLVASHDVCLGIFGDTDKALSVVPTKVYQGAAAGCAVITSDTAPQRRAWGDAAVLVAPAEPVALATALGRLAADPQEVVRLRTAAAERARAFDPWHAVGSLVAGLLTGEAEPVSSVAPVGKRWTS